MDLKSLVDKAYAESPEFKAKYDWRVKTRNRAPDLKWLMPLLEDALGAEFVMNAAKAHIAEMEAESAKEAPSKEHSS